MDRAPAFVALACTNQYVAKSLILRFLDYGETDFAATITKANCEAVEEAVEALPEYLRGRLVKLASKTDKDTAGTADQSGQD